jgi:hypothetical protein
MELNFVLLAQLSRTGASAPQIAAHFLEYLCVFLLRECACLNRAHIHAASL